MNKMKDTFKTWHATAEMVEEIKGRERKSSEIFVKELLKREPAKIAECLAVEYPLLYAEHLGMLMPLGRDKELNHLSKLIARLKIVMSKHNETIMKEVERRFKGMFSPLISNERSGRRLLYFYGKKGKNFWETFWCIKKALGIKDEL